MVDVDVDVGGGWDTLNNDQMPLIGTTYDGGDEALLMGGAHSTFRVSCDYGHCFVMLLPYTTSSGALESQP